MITELKKLKCKRCDHEWIPRQADVRICPNKKCHSWKWDQEKVEKKPVQEV